MRANFAPTPDECMQWLVDREDALSDLLNELDSAEWRNERNADDRHSQVLTATRAITIVRTIQMRLQATTAPLTPTGESLEHALGNVDLADIFGTSHPYTLRGLLRLDPHLADAVLARIVKALTQTDRGQQDAVRAA